MRRAPVLDQPTPSVPADATVDLLDVATARPAGAHGITLFRILGHQPHELGRDPGAAEWAHETGERPARAAEMTGQLAAPVLDQIGKGRRSTAAGANAQIPFTV